MQSYSERGDGKGRDLLQRGYLCGKIMPIQPASGAGLQNSEFWAGTSSVRVRRSKENEEKKLILLFMVLLVCFF